MYKLYMQVRPLENWCSCSHGETVCEQKSVLMERVGPMCTVMCCLKAEYAMSKWDLQFSIYGKKVCLL